MGVFTEEGAFKLGFKGCVGVHQLIRGQVRAFVEIWGREGDQQDSYGESGMGPREVNRSLLASRDSAGLEKAGVRVIPVFTRMKRSSQTR